MKHEMTLEELKKVQIAILVEVANYCDKSQIKYWIDSGTLLGAIRHKGYIPWDDDIDIGMFREDYDKFIRSFNSEVNDKKYEVHSIETDPDFFLPIAKVYDTTTLLYEPDENGFRSCVNIDIFVYDNAPDSDDEVKKMYDRRDRLRKRFALQHRRKIVEKNPLLKTTKILRSLINKAFFPPVKIDDMVMNAKYYVNEKTSRIGNFVGYVRFTCERELLNEFITVQFEDRFFKAPKKYDEWLKLLYGDYMQLPPLEKQVSHHSFKAYKYDN